MTAAPVSYSTMGFWASLERRLQRLFEGGFGRLSAARITPAAVAETALDLAADAAGATPANLVRLRLAPADLHLLGPRRNEAARLAAARVRQDLEERGLTPPGRVRVELAADATLLPGRMVGEALVSPGPGPASLAPLSGAQQSLRLTGEGVTVGRDPGCDVVLDSSDVSRRHARLEPRGETWEVVDLQSTNGTTVNGSKVNRLPLRDGDLVAFGPLRYQFREE